MSSQTDDEQPRVKAIKVHQDTWERFNRSATERGLTQDGYLRHLLRVSDGFRAGAIMIDPEDDTVLCHYQVYIHQPIMADGTIRRLSRRSNDETDPPAAPATQDPIGT